MRAGTRGATVVEVLVALAIGGVLFTTLMFAFQSGSQTVGKGMEALDALGTCAVALEHLRRDLRGLAGPLPAPVSRSAGEWSLDLLRLDGADVTSGRGRYAAVRWELTRAAGRTHLARDADGERTQFTFEGDVTLAISAEPAPSRVIVVQFAFPGATPNAARRAPVRAVLTRQDPAAPVRLVDGVPRIPRARILPDPDRAWGPSAAALYPPDVYPRGAPR